LILTRKVQKPQPNITKSKIHQNPSKSKIIKIKTHQNPKPIKIKAHQNPSKPIKTHQNPSKPRWSTIRSKVLGFDFDGF